MLYDTRLQYRNLYLKILSMILWFKNSRENIVVGGERGKVNIAVYQKMFHKLDKTSN